MNALPVTESTSLDVPTPVLPLARLRAWVDYANGFECDSKDMADLASTEYADLRALLKRLKAEYEYDMEPLREASRRIGGRYKQAFDLIEQASQSFNSKLGLFDEREKAKEREEQIRAREAQRLEQEQLAHDAAQREEQAAAAAEKLRDEAKRQADAGNVTAATEFERRADQTEMAGQQDAQQLIEQLNLTAPAEVKRAYKPDGITTRSAVEIESVDVGDTAVAVTEGRVPAKALKHDLIWLRQHAIAMGPGEFKVPGVLAHWRTAVAVKGKR